jgi:hypothetical protein
MSVCSASHADPVLAEGLDQAQGMNFSAKVRMHRGSVTNIALLFDRPPEGWMPMAKWWVLRILSDQKFDWVMGIVIIANSLTIGLQATAEVEKKSVKVYNIMEHCFLSIYCGELMMRFFCMGKGCLKSGWVVFDLVLVGMGTISSWVIEPIILFAMSNEDGANETLAPLMVLRVMRLLRLARSVRLLVQFKTLWMLVRGLLTSASTMFYTFMLMLLILYVFACVGIEIITKDQDIRSDEELGPLVDYYFSSVSRIMLTLVQFVTLDSIALVYTPLIHWSPFVLGFYFIFFIIVVSISLMNLVTAVIVEGAIEQGKQDREVQKAYEKQKIANLIPTIRRLFNELDTDGSGGLSLDEILNADEALQMELQKNHADR